MKYNIKDLKLLDQDYYEWKSNKDRLKKEDK